MRIAVFGASSGIGRELVLQARRGGHHVVAVARSIGSEAAASLTPVKGSVLDPGVAERAVTGTDAVAWCVGVKTLGPAFLRKVTVLSEGTRRTVEAMKGAGVRRLAVITGIGAGESRGHGGLLYEWIGLPLIVGAIYADKDRHRDSLRAQLDHCSSDASHKRPASSPAMTETEIIRTTLQDGDSAFDQSWPAGKSRRM